MSMGPVLREEDALPGSQAERSINDWNHFRRSGHSRTQVGRHVIGTFSRVRVVGVAIWSKAFEPSQQVVASRRVRIFLDQKTGRSVLAENRDLPAAHPCLMNESSHLLCDLVETAAGRLDLKQLLGLEHGASHREGLRSSAWFPNLDSNQDRRFQRPVSCRWTIREDDAKTA